MFGPLKFAHLCRFHAGIDFLTGCSLLLNTHATAKMIHGEAAANNLFGENGNDKNKLELKVAESLVGLLLVDIGIFLCVLSTSADKNLQQLTCKAALGIHAAMISWRLLFQQQVEAVRKDMHGQIFGDLIMASTWGFYLFQEHTTITNT